LYRFAGKEMGKVGNDGTLVNSYQASIGARTAVSGNGAFAGGATSGVAEGAFGSRLDYASSFGQGSGSGAITARGGESLQAIAASLWGDSGLWYKLAQANGLSGDTTLSAGQTLRIPAGVMRNTYNAATITPTDPNDTLGDVNPTTPQAAPPKKQKCGGFGTILLVIIAVAVTIATKGAAAKFAAGLIKAATGVGAGATLTGAAAATATVTGLGLAAAAGSVVSQAVGVATGIQDKFSWKDVGMSFISGGLGAGASAPGNWIQQATRAVVRSAVSQAVGVTLGLQDKFSWAAVAAAGVGSAAGSLVGGIAGRASTAVNEALGGGKLAVKLGTVVNGTVVGMADAIGNAAARSLIEGTDFGDNIKAALPSVLGNAIASGIFSGKDGTGSSASENEGPNLLDRFADGLLAGAGSAVRGIGSAVSSAATRAGDWLGFDGKFGTQGASFGELSVRNLGKAFRTMLPQKPVNTANTITINDNFLSRNIRNLYSSRLTGTDSFSFADSQFQLIGDGFESRPPDGSGGLTRALEMLGINVPRGEDALPRPSLIARRQIAALESDKDPFNFSVDAGDQKTKMMRVAGMVSIEFYFDQNDLAANAKIDQEKVTGPSYTLERRGWIPRSRPSRTTMPSATYGGRSARALMVPQQVGSVDLTFFDQNGVRLTSQRVNGVPVVVGGPIVQPSHIEPPVAARYVLVTVFDMSSSTTSVTGLGARIITR
jgi:hypothetical protein